LHTSNKANSVVIIIASDAALPVVGRQ